MLQSIESLEPRRLMAVTAAAFHNGTAAAAGDADVATIDSAWIFSDSSVGVEGFA